MWLYFLVVDQTSLINLLVWVHIVSLAVIYLVRMCTKWFLVILLVSTNGRGRVPRLASWDQLPCGMRISSQVGFLGLVALGGRGRVTRLPSQDWLPWETRSSTQGGFLGLVALGDEDDTWVGFLGLIALGNEDSTQVCFLGLVALEDEVLYDVLFFYLLLLFYYYLFRYFKFFLINLEKINILQISVNVENLRRLSIESIKITEH